MNIVDEMDELDELNKPCRLDEIWINVEVGDLNSMFIQLLIE